MTTNATDCLVLVEETLSASTHQEALNALVRTATNLASPEEIALVT